MAGERLVRALLRCYPAEFRDEYGREMAQLCRDQSSQGAASYLALAVDVARTAPREHLAVLLNDLRYAGRVMRASPIFAITVVLTVALAIGANTAIFSIVHAELLRPLPFASPDRLVIVAEKNDKLNLPVFSASVLNYLSWREQTQTLDLGAWGFESFNLSGDGDPEQFTGGKITPSLLHVLGVGPEAGRGFVAGEDRPGAPEVAMISSRLWKRRFGGDAAIVGRRVALNGIDYTVVGIAPPGLTMLTGGEIWVPLTIDPAHEERLDHVITVAGRLRPGVSIERAQSEMSAIAVRLGEQYPDVRDWGVNLVTFYRSFVDQRLQTALIVLQAAVLIVLLIACANIANLLLARSAARQKEIAIRTAIGASRARVVRQLLVESLLLSASGGGAGIVCAAWVVPIISRSLPPNLLPVPDIAVDRTVLAFSFVATLTAGLLFGLVPAWRAGALDLNSVLKQTSRSAVSGARVSLRSTLAAAELALATVLLIAAGLLIQTLLQLQRTDLGFQPAGLLTFQLSPPPTKYPLNSGAPTLYRSLLESVRALPGVRAAAVSSGIPFGGGNYTSTAITPDGPSELTPGTGVSTEWRVVSPGYFATLGVPILRGRDFTDADVSSDNLATIVSASTARTFWGSADPIGRTVRQAGDTKPFTVIGVVGNTRSTNLNREAPQLYLSAARRVWPLMDVVVRTDGDPKALVPGIRHVVRGLDPQLPIATVRTMDEWLSNTAAQPRLNAQLLTIFAAVALLVSTVGVYGVIAYSVNQRTREIGLLMALGAPRGRVLRQIIREGMTVGSAGIAVGVLGALAVSRVLSSLVVGVRVDDPATYAGVAAAIGIVTLTACALPARRASRVDPIVALRDE